LARKAANVLLQGIPRAEVAAVVCLTLPNNSRQPVVQPHAVAWRRPQDASFRPSRRLVAEAVQRGQGTLHTWDLRDRSPDFTVMFDYNWAICVPLPGNGDLGWGLYAAGRLQEALNVARAADLLKSDLKFAQVVADIYGALRQVRELQAEQVRVQTSLRLAHEVQAGFFPRKLPQVPGYEIVASSRSPEATGGDYYDVIPLASWRIGLVVADVSGHGLAPSLLMASLRALLRGFALRGEAPPERLLTDLNASMLDDLRPRHFITLVYGVLDPVAHRISWANAGHGPVVLHLATGQDHVRSLVEDEARGCPLGILPEGYQACAPVSLSAGDLLILGSDGVVETRRAGATFGVERLQEVILQHRHRPVQDVHDALLKATMSYHDGPCPDDDLTLLLLRRT
jgi:serine phosphatase RsbU (regulator of sigma subunit)